MRPDLSEVLSNQGGTAVWSLSIPADPSFAGLRLYNQAAVLGPVSATSFGAVGFVF